MLIAASDDNWGLESVSTQHGDGIKTMKIADVTELVSIIWEILVPGMHTY